MLSCGVVDVEVVDVVSVIVAVVDDDDVVSWDDDDYV